MANISHKARPAASVPNPPDGYVTLFTDTDNRPKYKLPDGTLGDYTGPQGVSGTVRVGIVNELPETALPTVENVGTTENAILNFGIPKGKAATVRVGDVVTGEPGSQVEVTNVGTEEDAVLRFVIPRGARGPVGPQGESVRGERGDDGRSVTDVAMKRDQIVFTFSDGQTKTVKAPTLTQYVMGGDGKGQGGARAAGWGGGSTMQAYTSLAQFPAAGAPSVLYLALDSLFLYYWNGNGYTNIPTGTAVFQFANQTLFPATGSLAAVYIEKSTNSAFYWDGVAYLSLGEAVIQLATFAAFPTTGLLSKVYIAKDVGKAYYWDGVVYVELGGGASGAPTRLVPGQNFIVPERTQMLYTEEIVLGAGSQITFAPEAQLIQVAKRQGLQVSVVASAAFLPAVGSFDVEYVTRDNGSRFVWDGATYQPTLAPSPAGTPAFVAYKSLNQTLGSATDLPIHTYQTLGGAGGTFDNGNGKLTTNVRGVYSVNVAGEFRFTDRQRDLLPFYIDILQERGAIEIQRSRAPTIPDFTFSGVTDLAFFKGYALFTCEIGDRIGLIYSTFDDAVAGEISLTIKLERTL